MESTIKNWELAFHFPTVSKDIAAVQEAIIEPLWESHGDHHVGLFRIVVQLKFHEQIPEGQAVTREAIAMEAIDVNGLDGYFEYAMPFEGKGVVETIAVTASKCQFEHGQLVVQWESEIMIRPMEQVVTADERAENKELLTDVLQQIEQVQVPQIDPIANRTNTLQAQPLQQEQPAIASPAEQQVDARQKVQTPSNQSHIFLNDLVEQYSIWHSSNFGPQQKSDNNE